MFYIRESLRSHRRISESDGGEGNSSASQDHHNHQHRFTEGEEEGKKQREDISSVRSMVTKSESMVGVYSNGDSTEEMAMKEDNAQIDWELKHEADSDSKNGSIEYVESVKESHGGRMSHDGGRSSSSSSSSDDESHVVDKNIVVIQYRESKELGNVTEPKLPRWFTARINNEFCFYKVGARVDDDP
ncbi:hypothetical protein LOK49_LG14G02116 [Camellia lanceoleosa]|uniref:Uncharacterized protein n=1 Tax=Camellia lanceoleosa TaxID=1840588 RepID=A0ACC0FGE7_9ERIC|nr:hypothetical protein LOK49_LG14G02116 [Camellia lanceoleosa]